MRILQDSAPRPARVAGYPATARRPRGRVDRVRATRVGLSLPGKMPFEEWQRLGVRLFRISDSSIWSLGDWLVYGQERFVDRYRQAIDEIGLDYQTLRNYAWIARKFDISRRRVRLSFQHHAEVAALPAADQDHWLSLAEQRGWSRNALRRQLREERPDQAEGAASVPAPARLRVAREKLGQWEEAASRAGVGLECWIVSTLDRAASAELDGR